MEARSAALALLCAVGAVAAKPGTPASAAPSDGIRNIQHVVMIMQENRSFDTYFGTFPGANGIPAGVCVPDPKNGGRVAPFHDPVDKNSAGPHGTAAARADIDGGSMDGFVAQAEGAEECTGLDPECANFCERRESCDEVMGYHDAREIPNYWAYAENFVLQDDMFESALSYSAPEHDFMVSAWNAVCPKGNLDPMACVGRLASPGTTPRTWTDVTYLLHKAGVSWRYYVYEGTEPDCESDEAVTCAPVSQGPKTPGTWNPLLKFTDVEQDGELASIQSLDNFYSAVHQQPGCGLPNVAWINPSQNVSEHPPSSIAKGQAFVTTLVNAIMRSPCWNSSAIFISWDDWGGFYDHVVPPAADESGYGLRVPGLVISPYAKRGFIDHQLLSHDAYLKFIEDDFLGGSRLDPATDGRPDRRPTVREAVPRLGDLTSDFDFNQAPRAPLSLETHPNPGPASSAPGEAPAVQTGTASAITQTGATLNASVNPHAAQVGDCHFEYGATSAYDRTAACSSAPGSGSQAVAVSASIAGLLASTTYHFRIVATNSGGSSQGADQTFTTLPEAPAVQTSTATATTQTGATLNASVNPDAAEVGDCHFEYGATSAYDRTAACSSAPGSGSAPVAVSASIAGLTANTTYHFRIVAANSGGSSQGADQTFTTLPEAPAVQTGTASAITQTGATLNASVNPHAAQVSDCHFEYGATVFYEASQPCDQPAGAGSAPAEASAAITGLSADSTYHFRIVAANSGGSSQGADQTFTTLPEAPVITSLQPAAGTQAGSDTVLIGGSYLDGASAVRFGEDDARSFSVDSPSSITAVTPPGTGTVDVFVTTPGGTSAASSADRFVYQPPPTVSKVVPRSGPVGAGVPVTIAGANLAGATGVAFGGVGAQRFEVRSASSIVAIAPTEPVGTVHVRVTTPGGTSAVSTDDRFTFTPLITAVDPATGTTAGGTVVTVTGEGFTTGTTIKFDTTKAAPVACASNTSCTAVSPAHAAGTVQVKAIVGGKSSTKTAGALFAYQ